MTESAGSAAIRGGAVTLAAAADAFLSSSRVASPNTRRAYTIVIDRLAAELGEGRHLATVTGEEVAAALRRLWGGRSPATWNRNRAAVTSWLTWCATKRRWPAPQLPADAERRKEHHDATRALSRAAVERLLSRRDVPLREKTLWRMLYETAARASEILALNVDDLDLGQRRAPIRSKGGDTEYVYWDTGTARLLPRLLRLPDGTTRTSGPLFLAHRKPVPARRPGPRDICPHTGRSRLGYDRARILFKTYTATASGGGLELHQLRHSAATHLGDQQVPLQLIMAKTRHKSPRTAMRYIKPGADAVAEITSLLGPPAAATELRRYLAAGQRRPRAAAARTPADDAHLTVISDPSPARSHPAVAPQAVLRPGAPGRGCHGNPACGGPARHIESGTGLREPVTCGNADQNRYRRVRVRNGRYREWPPAIDQPGRDLPDWR